MHTIENTKALSKRNRRARRNLVLKLALEAKFTPEITSYFNKIIKLTTKTFLEDRLMLDSSVFFPATRQLLSKQYKRVARAFVDDMRIYISKGDDIHMETKADDDIDAAVATALTIFLVPTVPQRANLLDKTTDKDIKAAFSEVQAQAIAEGIDLTETTFTALISKRLRDKFKARTPTISLTETQFSAEATKQIEAAVLSSGGDPSVVDPVTGNVTPREETLTFSKEWAAILDQKTRDAHVIADGQTVPASGEFIVGGDFLKFPGDPRGSAANIINCRCAALFSPVSSGPIRFRR